MGLGTGLVNNLLVLRGSTTALDPLERCSLLPTVLELICRKQTLQEEGMESQITKSDTPYDPSNKGTIQAFISYNSADRSKAERLKVCLEEYCIESFVAVRDIRQSQEWQKAIEEALFRADILIALLSEDFSNSDWTDQEVGVGIGRKIPIYPIKLGSDNPHGFLQKYQALEGNAEECAATIFRLLLGEDEREVVSQILRLRSKSVYLWQLANLNDKRDFPTSNRLAKFLDAIQELSNEEEQALIDLYNGSRYIFDANDFRQNILSQMYRLTGHGYKFEGSILTRADGQ